MILAKDMGTISFSKALSLQQQIRDQWLAGTGEEIILFLEHTKVLTLGRNQPKQEGLLAPANILESESIEVVRADRGGKWTFHGPGQLVVYFILDLGNRRIAIRKFVELLEEAMIRLLDAYNIKAVRKEKQPGVWTKSGKIGFVGLNVHRGITSHGISININGDLKPFAYIVPCGHAGDPVTSMEVLTGETHSMNEVKLRLLGIFSDLFGEQVILDQWKAGVPANQEAVIP